MEPYRSRDDYYNAVSDSKVPVVKLNFEEVMKYNNIKEPYMIATKLR